MSRVDQEFNLFKNFIIYQKDEKTLKTTKKGFTLEEVINGKNSFYAEIQTAIEKKYKISLNIWLRIKNLERMTSYTGAGQ